MDTGPPLHVEPSCNVADSDARTNTDSNAHTNTDIDTNDSLVRRLPLSPPLEPPSILRRKVRKKSIRNTKDSAEMARHRYHRDKNAHHHHQQQQQQQSQSLPHLNHANKVVDRHFSVANVGSNGTMYLRWEQPHLDSQEHHKLMLPRPVARPYPRAFRPPPTPPDTSDPQQQTPSALYWHDRLHQSAARLSIRSPEHTLTVPHRRSSFDSGYSQKSRHETDSAVRLRSPSLDSIPKQAQSHPQQRPNPPPPDATDSLFAPLLEVPIPNFRLGSPRFSDRGTAFLHNSYHTAFSSTTDLRQLSTDRLDGLMPPASQAHQNSIDLRRSPSVSWFSPTLSPAVETHRGRQFPSPLAAPPLELDRDEIPHTIYDKVAVDPDNTHYVRYADGTDEIVAATPTRLIAEITSVKFLDYDLLSDFFLTYRAFLSPSDLARYLVARLRWAVSQSHESGRVVRVRTFVALRHWILNYFNQDFEPDHELRTLFCNLVNKLALHLVHRPEGGAGDLQVLTELQKCWNRTCALVWGPTAAPQAYMPLKLEGDNASQLPGSTRMRTLTNESHMRNSSYMGNNGSSVALRRPDTGSRLSEASIQVTSCSFPMLKRSKHDLKTQPERASHHSPPKPRGLHRHKRSDSFSDALRDSRIDRPASSHPATEVQVRPGRIIRGLVIHPSSANVASLSPPSPPFLVRPEDTRPSMSETLSRAPDNPAHHARLNIFGSMRRALSTRNAGKSPFHHRPKTASSGDLRRIASTEPQPRDMMRQIQARKAQNVHIDALAAMVMRSWEQQGNEAMHELTEFGSSLGVPITRNRSKTIDTDLPTRPGALRLLSNVTTSSRSIMIIDDTGIDESQRTPDSEHPIAGIEQSRDDYDLSRQTTEEHNQAAIQDVAVNNTAFLLPYDMVNFNRSSWTSPTKIATLSTAPTTLSIMSSPHSPPPSVPLPPLPSALTPSVEPTPVVGDHEQSPDTEVTTSFATDQLCSPGGPVAGSPALSFRKSSLVDPTGLPGPSRQLRRKPGGNLRGVDTVHDLGITHRRQSTGSITSPVSIYGSPILTVTSGDGDNVQIYSRITRQPLRAQASDGDIFNAARRSSLRLLSTHSSLRRLRPSMEIEVARLREMPHIEDDGGVESALLKLEGRYIPSRLSDKTVKSFDSGHADNDFPSLTRQQATGQGSRISNEGSLLASPTQNSAGSSSPAGETGRFLRRRHGAVDVAEAIQPTESKPSGDAAYPSSIATKDFANSDPSGEFERPATPVQIEVQRPDSPNTPASTFLLDDGESLVDRNSLFARQQESKPSTDAARSFLYDAEDEDAVVGSIDHFQPPPGHQPLTPPTTADNISDHGFDQFNAQLLLPGPPTVKPRKSFRLSELLLSEQFAKKAEHSALPRARNLPTHHTPFILAHSSEALAMQFTIIEKDALDSVDWKDLINLNWSQKVPSVRDWAQYIHAFPTNVTDVSSIDLIITRFNLVIKWCISSVLLCATSEERARCITKFVHIATHSHRSLRNFATTAQITIALLSSDLSRLSTSWSKVAQAEKDALKNLETLVSPMRNFAVLRAEMESAAAGLSDDDVSAGKGVIPFLGVYTRDLALNAQKPAFISPAGRPADESNENLVNFERHRTTASIVKGVLRLLDASSRYAIKSDAEVLAKCLWLAALADDEIAELSKGLEK